MRYSFPSREVVAQLRELYPVGSRVELVYMEDMHAPPAGTRGTVRHVDDIGTVHVAWDNGSSLGAAYMEDVIQKVEV